MKKLLIVIGVIFSLLTCTVSAEDIATRIEVIPTVNGEEVSVLVEYIDNTDMCGGSFNFVYDKIKLELVSIDEGETIKNTTHFINRNYTDDTIRVNWVSTTEMSTEGDLLTIKFKLLDRNFSKTDISIDSLKFADENGDKLVAEYEVIYQEMESSLPSSGITTGNYHSSNKNPFNGTSQSEESSLDIEGNPSLVFKDVKENDWFAENVKYVAENGLMNGVTNTEFAPNDNLTRGMLVTVLYRAEGELEVNRSVPFADVTTDSYYANAVIWAEQNGIVKGVSETEFAPDENITREQIATIIYRFVNYKGYDTSAKADVSAYADADEISDYAIEAMQYAVASGLIKGKTETTLNPQDNATRAEIATILNRFIESNK